MGHSESQNPDPSFEDGKSDKSMETNSDKSYRTTRSDRKRKLNDKKNEPTTKKQKNDNEKPFKCTIEDCDKSYGQSKSLKRHIMLKHSDYEKDLMDDNETIASSFDGTSVSSDINAIKKHKCTYDGCQAAFRRPSRLVWHIRQHTGERPFQCTFENCDKAYATGSHLKRHQQTHENLEKCIVCTDCPSTFKSLQNLKKHYSRVHDKESRKLCCNICEMRFRKKYKLDEHIAAHNGIYHECNKCGKHFKTLYFLNKHIACAHAKKTYKCPYEECGEIFDTWNARTVHKIDCSYAPRYPCTECTKVFKINSVLKKHMISHEEKDMVYPCPIDNCSKYYKERRNLNVHMANKHLEPKKYTCDYCNVVVTCKSSIRRHITSLHMSDRPSTSTATTSTDNNNNKKKRRDVGGVKKSVVGKLIGLELPRGVQKELLDRMTDISIEDKLFEPPS
ncbi:hypothetical protein HCN44_009431 [Aphidius gifuensis]|uniref:C2H2-type domain-containing protein n=1 Tax=Aphidius gifuensis TaxID=684658 RepID=A0A834Y6G9_APHGI|nr:transcription factor IIIA-like isoform X2 [Aphidius gifuensis]KAF7998033.1 hypothetical protein HCN44_009431 [Aphidius gifuensis]